MNLLDVVRDVRRHLEENGRLSLRMIRRQFELDDDSLEEVLEELIDVQSTAQREGNVLVWAGASAPAAITRAAERSPRDYTPKHLADKILQSKSALEGERKQVTVMFADVKGSMELAQQLDPEQWHSILNRFFEILSEGVHRFEGTVNQYTGDGIMALFGAPVAHEDHAQRACYAALHLREEIAKYATEVKREHGVGFSARMGLNSGEVVVGSIGDDLRMDYTAQGHSVGLAQRMESLASPDTCYATAATVALAGGYFAFESLGEFRVKGVADEVEVYRLVSVGAARTRFDISRARGLSRFVGRAADLRILEDATARTEAGDGQVVGVVAMAGTGKSRLCFEFLERCRAQGMQIFEGRAVAHGKNIPYLPILEVFRAFFGITSQDDDRSAREKIAGRMVLLDLGFADALPLLFEFLSVADAQQAPLRLDPDARQRQLLAVIRKVTQSVSEERSTITLIEDLHWMDDASGEFLEQMVEAREGTRNMMLLNFRPEYHAEWMKKSWYRQIPLTPLGPEAIGELLADLLGDDPSIAKLAGPIHERTGGNPFFTEEVAQTLIESGHLEGERGAFRLVTPIDRLEVPATVQSVLAARIDRLPEREKRLLQVASVIGKDFQEPLLAEVTELSRDDLKASLGALRRSEFLLEQSIYPVVEYSFKHPLTQEVALGSQLNERRRTVHAAVARAIELQSAERLDERAPLLAHHYEEADEAPAALCWHRRAAQWVGATDFDAAAYHWGRVRKLVREVPNDRETAATGITACMYLLNSTRRLAAGVDAARELLIEGQALADELGDRRAHLEVSMAYSRTHATSGDTAAYIEVAAANQNAAFELNDVGAQANAAFYLMDAKGFACELAEVLEMAGTALERFSNDLPREQWTAVVNPYWVFSMWRVIPLAWMGRLSEACDEIGRGMRIAEDDETPEEVSYTCLRNAEIAYLMGDSNRAFASARQLAEVSTMLGEPGNAAALGKLAYAFAYLSAGRPADAIEPAREAAANAEAVFACDAAALLAEALLEAGETKAAEEAAKKAVERCRFSLRATFEAVAVSALARARMRLHGASVHDEVESLFVEVTDIIERTGATTLEPWLCEWRAELAALTGNGDARDSLLREAQSGFQKTGAPGHAERIARELTP